MFTFRRIAIAAAAAAAPLALIPATAVAAGSTSYHGVFTDVQFNQCRPAQPDHTTSGTWNVTIKANGAYVATYDIFLDGAHHVAYGVSGTTDPAKGHDLWQFHYTTAAGDLYVSYDGTTFTYAFPHGYTYPSLGIDHCRSVVYSGS